MRDRPEAIALQSCRPVESRVDALGWRRRDADERARRQVRYLVPDRLQGQELEDRVGKDSAKGRPVGVSQGASTREQAGHQTSESGIDALRFAMNSPSASSTPGSMGGASYSRSIRFQIALARWAASRPPSSCHCSKLLLSAISLR